MINKGTFDDKTKEADQARFSETNRVKKAQKLGAGKYLKKPYILEKIGLAVKAELN